MGLAVGLIIVCILSVGIFYFIYLLLQFKRIQDALEDSRAERQRILLEAARELSEGLKAIKRKRDQPSASEARIVGTFRGHNIYEYVITESGDKYDYDGIAVYDSFGQPVYTDPDYGYLIVEPGLVYKKKLWN